MANQIKTVLKTQFKYNFLTQNLLETARKYLKSRMFGSTSFTFAQSGCLDLKLGWKCMIYASLPRPPRPQIYNYVTNSVRDYFEIFFGGHNGRIICHKNTITSCL